MTTFRDYLANRRPSYDLQGDFVRLALRDKKMPEFDSREQLVAYVRSNLVLADFVEPSCIIWAAYVSRKVQQKQVLQRLGRKREADAS